MLPKSTNGDGWQNCIRVSLGFGRSDRA